MSQKNEEPSQAADIVPALIVQVGPAQVEGQAHANEPAILVQEPAFKQGLVGVHSLMSVAQVAPVQPVKHAQLKPPGVFVQTPPLAHARGDVAAHSLTSSAHVAPVQRVEHAQLNPPGVLLHTPELAHAGGDVAAHSSTSSAHVAPVQPVGHAQLKPPGVLVQTPFAQAGGDVAAHSSTSSTVCPSPYMSPPGHTLFAGQSITRKPFGSKNLPFGTWHVAEPLAPRVVVSCGQVVHRAVATGAATLACESMGQALHVFAPFAFLVLVVGVVTGPAGSGLLPVSPIPGGHMHRPSTRIAPLAQPTQVVVLEEGEGLMQRMHAASPEREHAAPDNVLGILPRPVAGAAAAAAVVAGAVSAPETVTAAANSRQKSAPRGTRGRVAPIVFIVVGVTFFSEGEEGGEKPRRKRGALRP